MPFLFISFVGEEEKEKDEKVGGWDSSEEVLVKSNISKNYKSYGSRGWRMVVTDRSLKTAGADWTTLEL